MLRPENRTGTVRVRVVGDPGGDPPEWVRRAWLGLELDATRLRGLAWMGSARGRRWYVRPVRDGWVVATADAVAVLAAAGLDDAAAWWRERASVDEGATLIFRGRACRPDGDT